MITYKYTGCQLAFRFHQLLHVSQFDLIHSCHVPAKTVQDADFAIATMMRFVITNWHQS